MGRLQKIEDIVAGTLPPHNNLKLIIRGRPRFLDPQLDGGSLRFAARRGAQFSAILPDNQSKISEDAAKDSNRLVMGARPAWMVQGTLIRVGDSEASGELHIVSDLLNPNGVETKDPLLLNYASTTNQERVPVVSLVGTPCRIYARTALHPNRVMFVESWYPIVPQDTILMSMTPDVLQSLSEYTVKRADFMGTTTEEPDSPLFTFSPTDVDVGNDRIMHTGHGLRDGTMIAFSSTGSLPYGLTPNVIYYVADATPDTFALTDGHVAVDMTFIGTGTHTLMVGKTLYRYQIELDTPTGTLPYVQAVTSFNSAEVDVANSTFVRTKHGLKNDTAVFLSGINLPAGVVAETTYFVINATDNTFQLAAALQGAAIPLSTAGAGLHPVFVGSPEQGLVMYLKANPLYYRKDFNEVGGDIIIPNDVGPCLVDAFHGTMLVGYEANAVIGVKCFDSFGNQTNLHYAVNQQWQTVKSGNLLILERPISSGSLLFWQRIKGNFQYQKKGFFQAELDSAGEFTMSTDLLVPHWPTDRKRGWVIPLFARSETKIIVQFEPQDQQIFTIKGNTLSFIRPYIAPDSSGTPIRRMLISMKGSPNSRVEVRNWEFDGPTVNSVSYFLLGTGEAWGVERWMAGGFSVKPLFLDMETLNARYSDGVSKYNAGYIYS